MKRGDIVIVDFSVIRQQDVLHTIGQLSAETMGQIDACLRAALALP
jgi:mRNA-degrading endonuclease toxin of MazEF toxin-antitoxin module